VVPVAASLMVQPCPCPDIPVVGRVGCCPAALLVSMVSVQAAAVVADLAKEGLAEAAGSHTPGSAELPPHSARSVLVGWSMLMFPQCQLPRSALQCHHLEEEL
jgi:hypothetical protein